MKLTDFIPGKETLEGFQGIEKQLQSRRYTGKWSLLVAVAAGVVQIVLAYPLKWQTLSFPAAAGRRPRRRRSGPVRVRDTGARKAERPAPHNRRARHRRCRHRHPLPAPGDAQRAGRSE